MAAAIYPGIASTNRTAFNLECSVRITIQAPREKIWAILADGSTYPSWNSTILGVDGKIAFNEKIRIKSTLDTNRSFVLRVSEFTPPAKMVWTDGRAPLFKGVRILALDARPDGMTDFSRVDRFYGILFPLLFGSLPDFKPIFETFAADLKKEAERYE